MVAIHRNITVTTSTTLLRNHLLVIMISLQGTPTECLQSIHLRDALYECEGLPVYEVCGIKLPAK